MAKLQEMQFTIKADGDTIRLVPKAEDEDNPATAGKPFGSYADMAACIADNQDKSDPGAYCAELERIIDEAGGDTEGAAEKAVKQLADDTRQALQAVIGSTYPDSWVSDYDPEAGMVYYVASADGGGYGRTWQIGYTMEDGRAVLVDGMPVEVVRETRTTYAPKGDQRGELTGPIVFKDAKKQIAYAAVLVPGEEDSDGEVVTAEKIEQVAHDWMTSYRNIDLGHTLNNIDAVPVETHILRVAEKVTIDGEEQTLPVGTWVLGSKFHDNEVWKGVVDGTYGGYSVMGVKKNVAMKSVNAAMKKTLLEDLGPDWVATHVSVVDMPAVPKAKWFALKSAKVSFKDRLRMAMAPKEGRKYSAKTVQALEQAHAALTLLIEEANEERRAKTQTEKSVSNLDDVILAGDVVNKVRKAIAGG